ncbi:hypothetical protein BaRGS_00033820 [Batillaria attramentaria]|uniref:Uncharacterized protein n=1 Tax=Batillaria attramentaria TaxID=370345 RepID=A0ABD0JJI1_9CAEN
MRIVIAFLAILQVVEGHGGGDCKRWCGYCDHGGCAWIVRKACCGHFDPSLLFPLRVDVNCSQPNRSRIIPPDNYSDTGESQQCSGFSLVHQHGCLTAMPESYCSYNTTRAIILRWNSLSEFPALSCLEKLGGLDLRNNELTSVPRDAFVGLTMLDEVRLDFNKITHIHPNAFDVPLPKLNRFSVSHNLLVSVEPWPLTVPHVFCYFGLSHNRISRLTNERHWTFNISVEAGPGWVDLRYNQFVEPPTAQLSQFRMSLSELGGEVLLWGINVRRNPYHCDCKAYGFARLLRFIYSFTPHNNLLGTCASPPKFKGMYVKDLPQDELTCNVTTNCPQGCACQERPVREDILVDCVDRDLTELPENMPDGKLTLLLANNSIGRTSARGYFRRVVRVDLSENSLEVFDESTPRLLKNAERVDLRVMRCVTCPTPFRSCHLMLCFLTQIR